MEKVVLTLVSLFLCSIAFSQSTKLTNCFQETIGDKEKVFTKTLYYPKYKGNEQELNIFITNEVDIVAIAKSLPDSIRILEDSIRVRFVISRTGQMSDITIEANNGVLLTEIRKAFIKSACDWLPGGTERYLPVWYNGTVYFRLEKQHNACTIMVASIPSKR